LNVAELISDAGPSRQSAVLHGAWREYAANAARPYAWTTFAQYARRHVMETGTWSLKRGKEKLPPWQDGARASPRPLRVAREIVRAKIGAELNATIPDAEARKREFAESDNKLKSARSG